MVNALYKISLKYQRGFGSLFVATIILLLIALVLLYCAYIVSNQYRLVSTIYSNEQAFEAASAGIQYGIANLLQNGTTISAGTFPTIPITNTLSNSLGQQTTYALYYTKPYTSTYPNVIQTNATGTSADGTATFVMSQQFSLGSTGNSVASSASVIAQGTVSLSGNAAISNPTSTTSIISGESVSLSGNANTQTQKGGSSSKNIGSDIIQNNASLASETTNALFFSIFNATQAQEMAKANLVLTGNVDVGSGPDGKGEQGNLNDIYQGMIIWVNGSASISGNGQLGTPTEPVTLITNGNFSVSGNGIFYGFVYVANVVSKGVVTKSSTQISGNGIATNGGVVTEGTLTVSGNGGINFNSGIITQLGLNTTTSGILTNTWVDF